MNRDLYFLMRSVKLPILAYLMNSCPVGVYWPNKTDDFQNRTILGRRMFDYEDTLFWFIDPDTLKTNPCIKEHSDQQDPYV